MVNIKNILISAVVAGIAAALFITIFNTVVRFIPVVGGEDSVCGYSCCLWLIAAGVLAAFLMKKMGGKVTTQDGAIVGMLAGAVAAVVITVLVAILIIVGFAPALPWLGALGLGEPGADLMGMLVKLAFLFMTLLLNGVVFCGVGAVLGAILLEKK